MTKQLNLAPALYVMSKLPKDVLVVVVNKMTNKAISTDFVNRVKEQYPLYFENGEVITNLEELNNLSNCYQIAA